MVRFERFTFDPRTGELREDSGAVVKLRRQLSCVLSMLTSRAGEIITREELRLALWGERTVVDFDAGLNFCIKRLRVALQDDADAPRFIETLPKRGYRFIAALTPCDTAKPVTGNFGATADMSRQLPASRRKLIALVTGAAILLAVAAYSTLGLLVHPERTDRLRLVVVPFDNLSGDATSDYVIDGLTDDMITQLGRLAPEQLGVIASISSMQYKSSGKSAARLGRDLQVGYVLTGSVRSVDPLHVNVQLVRTADETQLWAESYDRPFANVYAMQRDIAQNVARALALQLLPAHRAALARASTLRTEAYQEYLRGSALLREGTETAFRNAAAAFERALQYDHRFAVAEAALAGTHFLLYDYGFIDAQTTCRNAQPAVQRALALDDLLPQTHVWLAEFAATCARDFPRAEREFRRALELNRSDAGAHRRYGWFLVTAGRMQEALAPMQSALALDPLSTDAHAAVAYVLHRLGREQAALDRAQEALRLDPQFPFALYVAAVACARLERVPEAIAMLEHAVRTSGRGPKYLYALGTLYSSVGRAADARNVLDELTAVARQRYVPPEYLRKLRANVAALPSQSPVRS